LTKIILIGGASGTGKSSLSKKVANKFDYHHTLGTGFVRQIVRGFIPQNKNQYLHTYSYDETLDIKGFELLIEQSKPLVKPIISCIERARNEGTKLIVEGTAIIPSLFNGLDCDIKVILNNLNEEKHLEMVRGDSHAKRVIDKKQFQNIRRIQNKFIEDAKKSGWLTLDSDSAFEEISKLII